LETDVTAASAPTVLILPGWQNSGPDHWQSQWERIHGDRRVEQHDWMTPRRADWVDALERAVSAAPGDVVLVAHSLGCVLTAHWAAGSARTARVRGALLVAAPQLDRPGMPDDLADFRDAAWSRAQAQAWGAQALELGARGHINAESGLGSWPEGRALIAAWSLQHP
jgi:predicted alpha/beta hydrolase family esterase